MASVKFCLMVIGSFLNMRFGPSRRRLGGCARGLDFLQPGGRTEGLIVEECMAQQLYRFAHGRDVLDLHDEAFLGPAARESG
ncbi:MAG: hypothetical protein ACI9KE_004660, partial [Polyangiales bacterium]